MIVSGTCLLFCSSMFMSNFAQQIYFLNAFKFLNNYNQTYVSQHIFYSALKVTFGILKLFLWRRYIGLSQGGAAMFCTILPQLGSNNMGHFSSANNCCYFTALLSLF